MDFDYQICVPKKISCGFLSSAVFWVALLAILFVSIISGSAIFYGLDRIGFVQKPSEIVLRFAWFLTLSIGLLINIVLTNNKGSLNQKKCAGFAFMIAIVLITASSIAFEIGMYWYSFVGFIISCLMIIWLAYLSYKSTNGNKSGIIGTISASILTIIILILSFFILGRGIINTPENVNPEKTKIRSVNLDFFSK